MIWRSCREPVRTTSCSDRLSGSRGNRTASISPRPSAEPVLSVPRVAWRPWKTLRCAPGFPQPHDRSAPSKRLRVENAARLPHSDRRSTTSVFIYQTKEESARPPHRSVGKGPQARHGSPYAEPLRGGFPAYLLIYPLQAASALRSGPRRRGKPHRLPASLLASRASPAAPW